MKVLIMSASTGGGHKRASAALKKYILEQSDKNEVVIIDAIEECSKFLNFTITKGYHALATKIPELYGTFYETSDKDTALGDLLNGVNSQYGTKLLPIIEKINPDIIVSCHAFATKMCSVLKCDYGMKIPVVGIVTDFMPHRSYIGEKIDAYITPSDETTQVLSDKYGIDKDTIYTFGIPIFEQFYQVDEEAKEKLLTDMGLDPKKKTVLVMAGSFGVSDILKIYENLVEIDIDYQIIVITGRNQKLYDVFERLIQRDNEDPTLQNAPDFIYQMSEDNVIKQFYQQNETFKQTIDSTFKHPSSHSKPTKLLYFIENVDDYMRASDFIITKPGGLTTSESLACCLPMVIYQAFPGQEAQNAEFLTKNNMAIMLKEDKEGQEQIKELLTNDDALQKMKNACKTFAKPKSCEKLYSLLEEITSKKGE